MAGDSSNTVIIDDEIVSQWVEELSETPYLEISDDGDVYLGVPSELDRTVDTEPLDRLKITNEENYPPILSVNKLDEKKKLVISIDSNLIPQFIDALRQKAKSIEKRIRRAAFWLLILTSLTFILENLYNLNFPDLLTPVRLIAFWAALFFYVIADRIVLQGVTHGKPASMWGCVDCGNVQFEQIRGEKLSEVNCDQCGHESVALVQAAPGEFNTRGIHFENMLEQKLKSRISVSDGGNEEAHGMEKAKQDIDSFYDDENVIALYCLALEDKGLEWSDEDQEIKGGFANFSIHKTWGTRGKGNSDTTSIANSLKDAMLGHSILLRADEKDMPVSEQLDVLEKVIKGLSSD